MKNLIVVFSLVFLCSWSVLGQSIFRTVCQGNISRLDSLLESDAINEVEDDRGRSLLHWAVACKQKEMFRFLIEKGIEINQEDNQQKTPLSVAVDFNNIEFFDLLLKEQVDHSWIENYGMGLLEIAILKGNRSFISKLIEIGINVNGKNRRGSTPLEIAKRIGNQDIYDLLLDLGADEKKIRTIIPKGKYMGQKPPGLTPKLFAPNFISTEESEFGSIFNTAGTEFYYAVDVNGKNEIRYSKLIDNEWTRVETILSHERYGYNDPFLSNDENRLYFISKRAMDGLGELKDVDIWYVEKQDNGWSEPINAGSNINTAGNEYYISFTQAGRMYFSSNGNTIAEGKSSDHDIYYSDYVNGKLQKPVILGEAINTEAYEADVFITPDESYMIFCSIRENGFGRGDLYISFKDESGKWKPAINMGYPINTPHYEYCPFVTKDGKYLFYTSQQDIYWVSMEIIEQLKDVIDK